MRKFERRREVCLLPQDGQCHLDLRHRDAGRPLHFACLLPQDGQWYQLESGLHYNWHRHYDPSLGRSTQPDPLGFVDGPSVYGYVGGAPNVWVDPTGLGKIGWFIKGVKKCWKRVSKDRARMEAEAGRDVLVEGTGGRKQARQMGKDVWGDRSVRHDGHVINGERGRPHYQHRNGGRGHVFYNFSALTFVGNYGDHWYTQLGDFFNPFSDLADLQDLLKDDGESNDCGCEQ